MALVSRYLDPLLIEQLNRLEVSARSVVRGTTIGLHKSPVRGASVEFSQHRPYVPGDEPRRLDWRVLARTDRPYVKEYEEETNLRCLLLLDATGSMLYQNQHGSKFDAAAGIAAGLSYVLLRQSESVGLATMISGALQFLPPSRNWSQLARIVELIEQTSPAGDSDLARAAGQLTDRLGARALVVVLSDFFAPVPAIREAFARLRHRRHEVIAIRVLDPDELEFPFRTWTHFAGLEAEAGILAEPALLRLRYVERFRQHQRGIIEACRAMHVELHEYQTDRPLGEWLTQLISRRSRA